MKLRDRMTKLEQRSEPAANRVFVIKWLEPEETEAEATARYETENGPIYDPKGSALRVMIRQLG